MLKTITDIAQEIFDFIHRYGGPYSGWYVGITADPDKRLFIDHCVDKDDDPWIYRRAASANEARTIESYFIDKLGTDGGPGGGDSTCCYVYAYKKNSHTKP